MSWSKTFKDAKDPSDWAYLTCAVFSCGYSQPKRDHLSESYLLANTAETDCSYGVNWWLWKGGLLPECVGFSTRTMIDYLESYGFTLLNVDSVGPQRNDVLWRSGHTAMYIGDGLQAEALRTERGDAGYSGSTPGDQDGGETVVRGYRPYDWTYILRPPAPPAPKKNGWVKEEDWVYYVDDVKQKDFWTKYDGEWYYFGADGFLVRSQWVQHEGDWYYLRSNGVMARSMLLKWKDGYSAVQANGKCVKNGTVSVNVECKDWYVQLPK